MDKRHIINLTSKLYGLTLLFPKKEPLRYKIREVADDILAKFSSPHLRHNSLFGELEVLDSFFEVAKTQNWVKQEQLLKIQKEYSNLRREISEIKIEKQFSRGENPVAIRQAEPSFHHDFKENSAMAERKERILAFLRERGPTQVWQIKEILPQVTKRTLRRDFDGLLKQGLVERMGERNNTFYQIKNA